MSSSIHVAVFQDIDVLLIPVIDRPTPGADEWVEMVSPSLFSKSPV